jgi:molybdopterin-containing oxidoreductase family membrane subunit
VAGAIYSGFAMVLTLVIPLRALFRLQHVITSRHLESCAKLLLTTGLMVSYGYIIEYFLAWYSGDEYELWQYFHARPFGPGSTLFWLMLVGNVLVPQLFWLKRCRTNVFVLFALSLVINVGMWSERFVIIVGSLQREFLVSSWADYRPTFVDLGILAGTFCFFAFLFLLFVRFVPFVSGSEVKELRHELEAEGS